MADLRLEVLIVVVGFSMFWAVSVIHDLLSACKARRRQQNSTGFLSVQNLPPTAAKSCPEMDVEAAAGTDSQLRTLLRRLLAVVTGTMLLVVLAAVLSAVTALPRATVAEQARADGHASAAEPQEAYLQPPSVPAPSQPSMLSDTVEVSSAPPGTASSGAALLQGPELPQSSGGSNLVTISLTRQQISSVMEDGMHYKTAYWGEVKIGHPAEAFRVVFDTGSGHLILPSSYCHSATCRAHKKYRRSLSATARDINSDGTVVWPGARRERIIVSFGTGEVNGVFVEDIICMGTDAGKGQPLLGRAAASSKPGSAKPSESRIPAPGCMPLRMIAAVDMSEDPFKDFQFDGVLGLGLAGLSETPEFNLLHVVAQNGHEVPGRNPHMFAVFLANSDQEGSEIAFGGFKPSHLQEELRWQRVHNSSLGQWMLQVKAVRVEGEEPLPLCQDGGCWAIVDTGTSLLTVPSSVFPELFELLGTPETAEECRGPGPKLYIELEGITVTLEPSDYSMFQPAEPGQHAGQVGDANLLWQQEAEVDSCRALFMAMDLPEPLGSKIFVLGEPVLRKYYTVYETGATPRVGFGRARHAGSAEEAVVA